MLNVNQYIMIILIFIKLIIFLALFMASCEKSDISSINFCTEFNESTAECSKKDGGNLNGDDIDQKLRYTLLTRIIFEKEDSSMSFILLFTQRLQRIRA